MTTFAAPLSPRASTSGLPEVDRASAPSAPVARNSTVAPVTSSTSMDTMMPLGTFFSGSVASSAASGTPSTARKNQIANGTAAQMPNRPKGRNDDAPAAVSSTAMSVRLAVSNSPTAETANTTSPTSAIAVITNIALRLRPRR